MKRLLPAFLSSVILFCFFSVPSLAALSGNYTIDPASPASATNYQNFASAVGDLTSGTRTDGGVPNGSGVSGPVVFNVAAGTYTEQVLIDPIPGTSATNTVTFDGGNAATSIVTAPGNSTNVATFTLYGTTWVRLRNLTITNTSATADGWGILIYGAQSGTPVATNNRIENCIVNMPEGSLSNPNTAGIVLTGSLNTINTPGNFTDNTIDSCTIHQGYYGIAAWGWNINDANVVSNNTILDAFAQGIGFYGVMQFPVKIRNNYISSNSGYSSNRGIYLSWCGASATDYTEVSGNVIPSFNQVGIALSTSSGNLSMRNRIVNNFVGGAIGVAGTTARGINLSSSYIDVWFNSVNINYPTSGTGFSAFASTSDISHLDIRNNIFAYTATTGAGLPFSSTLTPLVPDTFDAFDYNIFYNASSADVALVNGTTYNTSFIGAAGFNVNSVVADPSFDNNPATNYLHVTAVPSPCEKGTAIPGITTDIDNQLRSDPPVIGADEMQTTLNVPQAPSGPAMVCQNQSNVLYTVDSVTGATGYTWSLPAGVVITSGDNNDSIIVDFGSNAVSGGITVQASDGCNLSASGNALNVTVNQAPVPTVTVTDATCSSCTDGAASATATGGAGPYTYTWDNGSTEAQISGLAQGTYTVCVSDANGCSACVPATVSFETGLNNTSSSQGINVFPNPASGAFTISLEKKVANGLVEVFGIGGQKIWEAEVRNSDYIYCEAPPAQGLYIVRVTTDHAVYHGTITTR